MFVFENLRETTTNLIGRRELVRLYHPTTTTDEMPFTDQSKIMTAVSATLCRSRFRYIYRILSHGLYPFYFFFEVNKENLTEAGFEPATIGLTCRRSTN